MYINVLANLNFISIKIYVRNIGSLLSPINGLGTANLRPNIIRENINRIFFSIYYRILQLPFVNHNSTSIILCFVCSLWKKKHWMYTVCSEDKLFLCKSDSGIKLQFELRGSKSRNILLRISHKICKSYACMASHLLLWAVTISISSSVHRARHLVPWCVAIY